MEDTPERAAWLAGRDAGVMFATMMQTGGIRIQAKPEAHVTPELFAAWLSGYGYGISGTAGCIPGHHLAHMAQSGRTELVPDR